MQKFITKIKCRMLNDHRIERYQTKIVEGIFGKIEAQKTKCMNCEYVPKYWIAKEKWRQPIKYD